MMKQASVNAHAKINLTLDVTGRREDGYHLVAMVMQSIGLCDTVQVSVHTGTGDIALSSDRDSFPCDRTNLCWKAAESFFERTGIENDGIRIHVEKRIPMAAGLAGGSTDAAAVLVLLNKLYETGLSEQQLCETGLTIGADVPFCIMGGTMLAEGIGERLTRLPDAPDTIVVLCKPPVDVSTPVIYRALDSVEIAKHPDNAAMTAAIEGKNIRAVAEQLENVMQPVTAEMHPEILEIRKAMLDCGALNSIMSGSGPTVFGLFDSIARAEQAAAALKNIYRDTYTTTFSNASMTELG